MFEENKIGRCCYNVFNWKSEKTFQTNFFWSKALMFKFEKNRIMSRNIFFLFIVFAALIVSSCGKDKNKIKIKSAVASFASNQEDVIGYGYIDIKQMLDKSKLAEVKGIGNGIADIFTSLESGVNLESGIHYALTGPIDRDGMPDKVFAFFPVENKDSLKVKLEQEMGYLFEEEDGLMMYDDMSTAIGFNDEIAIVVMTQFGAEPKLELKAAFIKSKIEKQNPKIVEILDLETDILLGANLSNLYSTSNTSLNKLPENRKKQITEMLKDGHYSATIDFNEGNITAELNTDRVSDALKEEYFFKSKFESAIFEKLGPGTPIVAFAASMDLTKMEELVVLLQPEGQESPIRYLGLGDQKVSDIIDGEFGFALNSAPDMATSGMIPAFNFYASVGENYEFLKDLADVYSEEKVIEDLGEGYYRYQETSIARFNKEEIVLQSNAEEKTNFKTGKLNGVRGMKNFGDQPLSVFIDVKALNEADISGFASEAELLLKLTDYVTIEANNKGSKMVIQLLNKNENVLSQILDAFRNDLKEQFGGGLLM